MLPKIFIILFALSLLGYVVGLINPRLVIRWGNRRTRSQVILYFGVLMGIFAISFFLTSSSLSPVEQEGPQTTIYIDEEMISKAEMAREAVDALLTQNGYGPLTLLLTHEGAMTVYALEELGLYLSILRDSGKVQIEWNGWAMTATRDSELEGLIDGLFRAFAGAFIKDSELQELMQALNEICLAAEESLEQIFPGVHVGQDERKIIYGNMIAALFCRKVDDVDITGSEKSLAFSKYK